MLTRDPPTFFLKLTVNINAPIFKIKKKGNKGKLKGLKKNPLDNLQVQCLWFVTLKEWSQFKWGGGWIRGGVTFFFKNVGGIFLNQIRGSFFLFFDPSWKASFLRSITHFLSHAPLKLWPLANFLVSLPFLTFSYCVEIFEHPFLYWINSLDNHFHVN